MVTCRIYDPYQNCRVERIDSTVGLANSNDDYIAKYVKCLGIAVAPKNDIPGKAGNEFPIGKTSFQLFHVFEEEDLKG